MGQSGGDHRCDDCGESFAMAVALGIHIRQRHTMPREPGLFKKEYLDSLTHTEKHKLPPTIHQIEVDVEIIKDGLVAIDSLRLQPSKHRISAVKVEPREIVRSKEDAELYKPLRRTRQKRAAQEDEVDVQRVSGGQLESKPNGLSAPERRDLKSTEAPLASIESATKTRNENPPHGGAQLNPHSKPFIPSNRYVHPRSGFYEPRNPRQFSRWGRQVQDIRVLDGSGFDTSSGSERNTKAGIRLQTQDIRFLDGTGFDTSSSTDHNVKSQLKTEIVHGSGEKVPAAAKQPETQIALPQDSDVSGGVKIGEHIVQTTEVTSIAKKKSKRKSKKKSKSGNAATTEGGAQPVDAKDDKVENSATNKSSQQPANILPKKVQARLVRKLEEFFIPESVIRRFAEARKRKDATKATKESNSADTSPTYSPVSSTSASLATADTSPEPAPVVVEQETLKKSPRDISTDNGASPIARNTQRHIHFGEVVTAVKYSPQDIRSEGVDFVQPPPRKSIHRAPSRYSRVPYSKVADEDEDLSDLIAAANANPHSRRPSVEEFETVQSSIKDALERIKQLKEAQKIEKAKVPDTYPDDSFSEKSFSLQFKIDAWAVDIPKPKKVDNKFAAICASIGSAIEKTLSEKTMSERSSSRSRADKPVIDNKENKIDWATDAPEAKEEYSKDEGSEKKGLKTANETVAAQTVTDTDDKKKPVEDRIDNVAILMAHHNIESSPTENNSSRNNNGEKQNQVRQKIQSEKKNVKQTSPKAKNDEIRALKTLAASSDSKIDYQLKRSPSAEKMAILAPVKVSKESKPDTETKTIEKDAPKENANIDTKIEIADKKTAAALNQNFNEQIHNDDAPEKTEGDTSKPKNKKKKSKTQKKLAAQQTSSQEMMDTTDQGVDTDCGKSDASTQTEPVTVRPKRKSKPKKKAAVKIQSGENKISEDNSARSTPDNGKKFGNSTVRKEATVDKINDEVIGPEGCKKTEITNDVKKEEITDVSPWKDNQMANISTENSKNKVETGQRTPKTSSHKNGQTRISSRRTSKAHGSKKSENKTNTETSSGGLKMTKSDIEADSSLGRDPVMKERRDMSTVVCHRCGKTGHIVRFCIEKEEVQVKA